MIILGLVEFLCFSSIFLACLGQIASETERKSMDEDMLSKKMSIDIPPLTEEESEANFVPDSLLCDACTAIALKYATVLQKDINKIKAIREGKKEISEGRLIEIFEDVCDGESWNDIGLKEINGVKHLSYPGSKAAEAPGVLRGGGRWPSRLSTMCFAYVERHEERKIYKAHMKEPENGIYNLVCKEDCKGVKEEERPADEL